MSSMTSASAQGLLCIMGSGETAPTMVKVHRSLISAVEEARGSQTLYNILDTPYGFQENADELSQRAQEYFQTSLNRRFEVASLRTVSQIGTVDQDSFYDKLTRSSYVFAGPGSPTYALRVWKDLELSSLLSKVLSSRRVVTFSSAAALTLGSYTLPVYEIYKAGEDLRWESGLGLLDKLFGRKIAVVPHYNNQEGGTHDTRYCYMGERRISVLERELPEDAFILGIDEHSGVIFDLKSQSIETVGIGLITIRRAGSSLQITPGTTMPISEFLNLHREEEAKGNLSPVNVANDEDKEVVDLIQRGEPLEEELLRLQGEFEEAIDAGNFLDAAKKILELEGTLKEWETDSLMSDINKRGRAQVRSMILRLGQTSTERVFDPSETIAPYVKFILEEREKARASKNFERSDQIRDLLTSLGIEVQDSPQGTSWSLKDAIVSSTVN
ncbi:hypothetical protein SAMN02745225_00774 [Ferrithrix thermotolerans DSM 19514]|uniref:Cysteinyl-tRNA ligase anticodon binding domain-containing protein n=1 Tax=Ferrithrix thermotolerans DSM 19514 TaxID=1121881 RepID=A0A1M4TY50_9ACTN|nr:hypothetical protein [Ferrithrix thermotolerans]SHE49405.1 hypothetical protein SAMN02745225_00774 [Ferrithrix thermotolerans DSM 19514]